MKFGEVTLPNVQTWSIAGNRFNISKFIPGRETGYRADFGSPGKTFNVDGLIYPQDYDTMDTIIALEDDEIVQNLSFELGAIPTYRCRMVTRTFTPQPVGEPTIIQYRLSFVEEFGSNLSDRLSASVTVGHWDEETLSASFTLNMIDGNEDLKSTFTIVQNKGCPRRQTLNVSADGTVSYDTVATTYAKITDDDDLPAGWDLFSKINRSYFEFDITTIPDTSTIGDLTFKYHGKNNAQDSIITNITTYQPSSGTAQQVYEDIHTGFLYATPSGFPVIGASQSQALTEQVAHEDFEDQLSSDWFALGTKGDYEDTSNARIYASEYSVVTPTPALTVIYVQDHPDLSSSFLPRPTGTASLSSRFAVKAKVATLSANFHVGQNFDCLPVNFTVRTADTKLLSSSFKVMHNETISASVTVRTADNESLSGSFHALHSETKKLSSSFQVWKTATFYCDEAGYSDAGNKDYANNANTTIETEYHPSFPGTIEKRAYIDFPFPSIASATDDIDYCQLKIYCYYQDRADSFYLARCTANWNSNGVTWNNAPAVTDEGSVSAPNNGSWTTYTVTTLVKAMYNAGTPRGFRFREVNSGGYGESYYRGNTHSNQPRIVMRYK